MRLRDCYNSLRTYKWQKWDRDAGMQRPGGQAPSSATYEMPAVFKNNGKQVEAGKRQREGKVRRLSGDGSEQSQYSGRGDQEDPRWLQRRGLSCTMDVTVKFTK